ncbi:MAG: DUF1116 domain-containing protein [Desulfovibrio sp.]|jgi:hypothetical protein|nr:DUF1116 domain-containing protein [Desulfovibrio sp.]
MADITRRIHLVNVGLEGFFHEIREQGTPAVHVDWRPPASGDVALMRKIAALRGPAVEKANAETVARIKAGRPVWVDVQPAAEAIYGMERNVLLHSGPPIDFFDMCDPQQRAVEAAAIFEGWATDRAGLAARLKRGDIRLLPNYVLGSVGAMCGVISPSMPVVVTENVTRGNRSWTTFNEGKGAVIWMGAYNEETFRRLRWMRDVLAPGLRAALRATDEGIDIFPIIAEGVLMGDEVHARSAACTLLLLRRLTPLLLAADVGREAIREIVEFIGRNNHSFLSLTLTACKTVADAAHGLPGSTVVTAMSRNGVDFALRVGGMDAWFIAPTAPMDEAIYYSGYGPEDAAGDIGDSAIVETVGLGGMIIGAAPSISSFVGGSMRHSRRAMSAMRSVCAGENPAFAPGSVDFMPAPVGIDIRQVVRLGVSPIIDTGVLHKRSGVGQIGTGIARAPLEAFRKALAAMPLPQEN